MDKDSTDIDLMQTSTPANSRTESKSFRSSESTERRSVVYSMIKDLISDSTSPELMNQSSNNQRLEALERRMNDAEIKYIGLQEELAKINSSKGDLLEGSSVEASESFMHEGTEEVKIKLNDLEINYKNLQEKLAVTDSIQEKLQEKLSVGAFENILHECRDAARKMDDRGRNERIAFNAKVEDFSQKLATLDATMMDQIDHLKNLLADQLLQLEGKIRRMKKIFEDQDPCNAAGGKNKALGDLACISCNRYVTMRLNEQQCLSTVLAKPLSRTTQGCPEKTNKKFEKKKTSDNFREGEKRLAGGKHTIISSSDRQAHMSMRSEGAINSNAMRLICIDTQTPSDDGTQRILGGIITGVLASKNQ
uniref:DUF4795 domain-containing protein n=1 Tax=Lutzomyia longipalpis TaxID=7200 RepID=A0A1B0CPW9_LUTLO